MAWDTKMSSLLASAMIAEAVAVEYLRGLGVDGRSAAAERITATLQASMKQFAETKIADPADGIKHRMMVGDLERRVEPMLKTLIDLASSDG